MKVNHARIYMVKTTKRKHIFYGGLKTKYVKHFIEISKNNIHIAILLFEFKL